MTDELDTAAFLADTAAQERGAREEKYATLLRAYRNNELVEAAWQLCMQDKQFRDWYAKLQM